MRVTFFVLAAVFLAGPSFAGDRILQAVHELDPKATVSSVTKSPLPGMSLVTLNNNVLLVSNDGRYVVQGDLFDLKEKRDISDDARSAQRSAQLKTIPDADRIVIKAPNQVADVVAFVDTECQYCRAMLSHLDSYTKAGITLELIAYPRAGYNTDAYRNAQAVWCSADRKSALLKVMLNNTLPPTGTCPDIIKKQLNLATDMSVPGTPALLDRDGRYIGGFLQPEEVLKRVRAIDARSKLQTNRND